MHGFYRVAAASPRCETGSVTFNLTQIKKLWQQADARQTALIVFPELCITGYSCGDLFSQEQLLDSALKGLGELVSYSKEMKAIAIIGAPLLHRSRLYNCAVVLQSGKVLGVVCKSHLANHREYYEKRWFSSGKDVHGETLVLFQEKVPFGSDIVFRCNQYFAFGVEICEDLWNPTPPSSALALNGATIICNPSASNAVIGKPGYRRLLVQNQSARCFAGYVYASCGITESTTDLVYDGHTLIAENNELLAEGVRFSPESQIIFADIDCQKLVQMRISESSFADQSAQIVNTREIAAAAPTEPGEISRKISAQPFVPAEPAQRDGVCEEITFIQSMGLRKRLSHTQVSKAIIGVSGGLDSALALLVVCRAFDQAKIPRKNIIGVTMPSDATSSETLTAARGLMKALQVTCNEIPIQQACDEHFKAISFDPKAQGITFENVQARERTQILMSLANKESGLVVGTGDLSEIALGWSTYCGDHMSMYNVNCGVPKSLVKYLISWHAHHAAEELSTILKGILALPISPELISSTVSGKRVHQKTEELIGPYELHDFFLYHMLRYGASPEKILALGGLAFAGKYGDEEIKKWLVVFLKRFFTSQFKRSCMPDGPKVGTISLSPRGDWRMPSDAAAQEWLASIND